MKKQNVFRTLRRNNCDSLTEASARIALCAILSLFGPVAAAKANTRFSDICDRAARIASNETGIPAGLISANIRAQTACATVGVSAPRLWAVCMQGVRFDTSQAALNDTVSLVQAPRPLLMYGG